VVTSMSQIYKSFVESSLAFYCEKPLLQLAGTSDRQNKGLKKKVFSGRKRERASINISCCLSNDTENHRAKNV